MFTVRTRLAAPLLAAAVAITVSAAALAHGYTVGKISIGHPWAKASAGMAANGAAFMTIANAGNEADRLITVQTTAADRAELHMSSMKDGIMKMQPVDGIDIPANGTVALQPGGLHVMLFGLKAPLKEKDKVPMTLTFEKSGRVDVDVQVESLATTPADAHKTH